MKSGGRCPRFQRKKQIESFDLQFALATMPVKQHRCCHGTTATMASLPATEPLQWTVRQKTFPNHTLCHTTKPTVPCNGRAVERLKPVKLMQCLFSRINWLIGPKKSNPDVFKVFQEFQVFRSDRTFSESFCTE